MSEKKSEMVPMVSLEEIREFVAARVGIDPSGTVDLANTFT
tara:strand:- start:334 stop:456 length:123 start_codon:yes stop_codon:yes gene_type:complete